MKKAFITSLLLLLITACSKDAASSVGFTFQLPKNWEVKEISESKAVLNAPVPTGYEIVPTVITLFHFSKESHVKLEDVIAQKQAEFPHSSFEGECYSSIQFPQSTLYRCGRWTEDLFVVNLMGTKVVAIFLGQDPFLSSEEFVNLISFENNK